MQNTVRWRSDQLDGAVVGSFLGTPWSNESDANPPEGDNPRNVLFSSRIHESFQFWREIQIQVLFILL